METEVRYWLVQFAQAVRNRDYENAWTMFAPDVIGFGTVVNRAEGLEELDSLQWRHVWEITRGFHFLEDRLVCRVSGEMAWVAAEWTSEGVAPGGGWFDRRGRATIVLERRNGNWLAVHTHLSFTPTSNIPRGAP